MAEEALSTRVTLAAASDGVVARYSLSRPAARFRFDSQIADIRIEGWTLEDKGLAWDGDAVVSRDGRPFRAFTVKVLPDARQRDRIYPALTRLGPKGWVIYEPHFAAHVDQGPTRLTMTLPRGHMVLPALNRPPPDESGYVFFGPKTYGSGEVGKVVADPAMPAWLVAAARRDADEATTFFTDRLGAPLAAPPLMLLERYEGKARDFRGDVSNGQTVFLRFYGGAWADPDAASVLRIGQFTAHEYFHFWNGRRFRPLEADTAAWLHEGAAEYASRLAMVTAGRFDDAAMRKSLEASVNGCIAALGDRGLRASGPKTGRAVYDCGVVAQWLADLQVRAASSGGRDVLDAWKAVFADDGAARQGYGVTDFLREAGAPAGSPLDLLLAPTEGRWSRLATALKPFGAVVTLGRSGPLDRRDVMFHLLGQACSGDAHGFFANEASIRLDTGKTCGPLSGDPEIDAVAGEDIMAAPSAAFDAVQTACAQGGTVTFSRNGRVVATTTCAKPLGAPPVAWTIERWR